MSHGPDGFGRKILGGASWFAAARVFVQLIQLGTGVVLARILTPADFGSFASVNVIVGFAVILIEGGMTSALVHRRAPTESDYATVFWVNAAGGVLLALALWLGAPLISEFYGNPVLLELTPVVGLTFALSLSVVHRALAIRAMRYRIAAVIESTATVVGLAVTLALALMGVGVIALAVGPVLAQLVASVVYAVVVKWRPTAAISWRSLQSLLAYSSPLVGATTAEYWGRNADNLLIGRFLGPAVLGYYSRAYNLMSLPVTQVTNAIGSAVSAGLARMADDSPRVGRAYMSTVISICAVVVPGMTAMALLASDLVPLLWGAQWTPAIPILQVLCLAAIPQCLSTTTTWLFQAEARTATMLRVTLTCNIVAITGMLIAVQWSAIAVAWVVFARYAVGTPFEIRFATVRCGFDARRFSGSIARILLASSLMAAGIVGGKYLTVGWTAYAGPLLLSTALGIVGLILATPVLRPITADVRNLVRAPQ